MAEIKIEKKSPIWPWILLIAAILAVLIYLFTLDGNGEESNDRNGDRTEQTTEESAETRQEAPNNSTVITYLRLIKEDPDPMGLDHEFTNEALLKLIDATRAMANEIGHDIQRDIEEVKTLTNKITSDPFETNHANAIKESAEILANVLKELQQKAFPTLTSEANEVQNAVADIGLDVQTLEQKEEVKNFFRQSANLLKKMNNNSPQIKNHVRKQ